MIIQKMKMHIYFYRLAFLILVIMHVSGCKKSESTGLNRDWLHDLFRGFTPVYNYDEEDTEMLGHAACIDAAGFDSWYDYLGVADSLGSRDIDEYSMFRIGSATKMFTAVMILQLWEEGIIDLDEPFNTYLDLDEVNYPKISLFSDVTVRHLLSHRSGISMISSTSFFDYYQYTDAITQEERLKFLFTDCDPEFAPGTQYAYRNSNFNILGLIIEKVTGTTYWESLQIRVCTPLGLSGTHVLDYDINASNQHVVHGYTVGFDGTRYHGSQAWAAGGIVSTVHDLSTFMRSLVEGDLFESNSTFNTMSTPVQGGHYGLGLFITQTPRGLAYGHSGAIFGFNTRCEYFPGDDAVIISLMNFNGYDFMVTNWYDDYCYPVIDEIRRAG